MSATDDYQARLTAARREAYWRALARMREAQRATGDAGAFRAWQGRRRDQVEYSLAVVAACALLGVIGAAGFVVGQVVAFWTR